MESPYLTCGIDLGGTSVRVGLFDADLRMIGSSSMATRVASGPDNAVAEIVDALRKLMNNESVESLLGIGIGSPGPINLRSGVLGPLPNLPGWENYPLRDALAEATDMPVILESDANAAAVAEWKLGAGRDAGLDSLAMMTLGTGVGSGLILNGQVWHGIYGMGGEVGHTVIQPDGDLCGCGSRGCLEMYASAAGLCRLARQVAASSIDTSALGVLISQPSGFDPKGVADLAARGDIAAKQVFVEFGRYLGLGIANLISTLDLPLVIVGGGVATAWSLFAQSMFGALEQHSVVYRLMRPNRLDALESDRTAIVPAKLGSSAGLLGAALLPRLEAGEQNRGLSLSWETHQ
jgi:glucokinase